jgi:crossover junction endodeoxyribonuclease RuvC
VFVNNNPQATLMLGQARGACVTALVSADMTVHEYTALQLKKAVAGHGRAAKEDNRLTNQIAQENTPHLKEKKQP